MMGIKSFFRRREDKAREKREEQLRGLKEKAAAFESKAALYHGIAKQRDLIGKAKRTMLESSPAFRAIGKMQKAARKIRGAAASSGYYLDGDFGSGSAPSRPRKQKRKRRTKRNGAYRPEPLKWF